MPKLIAIVYNSSEYVVKTKRNLISALKSAGYKVLIIAPEDKMTPDLQGMGVEYASIRMTQYGMNPLAEMRSILDMVRALKKYRPIAMLNFTIKPNLLGSIAGQISGTPVINNITGTGSEFSSERAKNRKILRFLYRIALRKSHTVFFQNDDDRNLFINLGLVQRDQGHRIPGSGVDLERYVVSPIQTTGVKFLFIGRLIKLKGIKEYLLAANRILDADPSSEELSFHIIGEHRDAKNFISKNDLAKLSMHPRIHYHGEVAHELIKSAIAEASCVVLPTYYGEGVPRVLLEACASGRPIITTDNAGSRDVVQHGINGYKIKSRDVDDLTEAMRRYLKATPEIRTAMGINGRKRVECEFDESIVIRSYLTQISKIEAQVR